MISDVVLPDMSLNECKQVMKRVRKRIAATMGTPPDTVCRPVFEVVKKYANFGLEHWLIRYKVLPDATASAIIVFPKDFDFTGKTPCVMCMHGTTNLGKLGCLTPSKVQKSPYGIELALRGYITFTPDQYWFGDYWKWDGRDWEGVFIHFIKKFYKQYPNWSLDGRRLWDMQRALDIICTLKFVNTGRIGVIGNSLGGRSVMFIAAFDERIQAAVSSTGVSPNVTNVYRGLNARKMSTNVRPGGKAVYEYQEMISLCAPRSLLMIEPFNDEYNPYISVNMECFVKAAKLYSLYKKPENLAMIVHGDRHGTLPDKREMVYVWFDKFLMRRDGLI
jgi:dienelactone hydrolase